MPFVDPASASPRSRTLPLCVPALLFSLLCAANAAAQLPDADATLPVLTHISQIRQLTADQAARGYPVRIRAVVTYYSPTGPNFLGRDTYMSAATPDLFVQDATAGVWVNVPAGSPVGSPGTELEFAL